jgi:hypothetical protein
VIDSLDICQNINQKNSIENISISVDVFCAKSFKEGRDPWGIVLSKADVARQLFAFLRSLLEAIVRNFACQIPLIDEQRISRYL